MKIETNYSVQEIIDNNIMVLATDNEDVDMVWRLLAEEVSSLYSSLETTNYLLEIIKLCKENPQNSSTIINSRFKELEIDNTLFEIVHNKSQPSLSLFDKVLLCIKKVFL